MAINKLETQDVSRMTSGQVIVDLKSIIKELVENSIDANCTKVDITFQNYGIDAITVMDDGVGINVKDFESVCLRGHTSKLEEFSDLELLTTLGFRGEALSSVCSIARRVKIHTSTKEEYPKTYELEYNHMGTLVNQRKKVGGLAKFGTSVVIEEIFSNLPVRHKNMVRNQKKEFNRAINFLINYLIIQPHIKFSVFNVTNKKNIVLSSVGGKQTSILDSMVTIFGTNGSRGLSFIDTEISPRIRINGFISNHSFGLGRSVQDRQFLYINKRPILHKKIQKLINEVFKLYNHLQYPVFVLNFQTDPKFLDINVTPDKTTILFHNEIEVYGQLRDGLTRYFATQDNLIPKNKYSEVSIKGNESINASGSSCEGGKESSIDVNSIIKTADAEVLFVESSEDDVTVNDSSKRQQEVNQDTGQYDSDLEENLEHEGIAPNREERQVKEREQIGIVLKVPDSGELEFDLSLIENKMCLKLNKASIRRLHDDMITKDKEMTYEPEPEGDESMIANDTSYNGLNRGSKDSLQTVSRSCEAPNLVVVRTDATFSDNSSRVGRNSFTNNKRKAYSNDSKTSNDILPTNSLELINHDPSCHHLNTVNNYGRNFYPADLSNDTIDFNICEMEEHPMKRARKQNLIHNLNYSLPLCKSNWAKRAISPTMADNQKVIRAEDLEAVEEQEERLSYTISKDDFMKMKLVGQFNLGFILVSLNEDDLFIIDQHASDEKYNFERLSETFVMGCQRMVVPQYIDMSIIDEILVIEHQKTFQKNGFLFEVDGERDPGRQIRLLTLPVLKSNTFGVSDFYELINLTKENPTNVRCSKIMRVLAMRACRGSTMIGQSLTKSRMKEIVSHLHLLEKPWNCPHGRPTMRHLVQLNGWKPCTADYDI